MIHLLVDIGIVAVVAGVSNVLGIWIGQRRIVALRDEYETEGGLMDKAYDEGAASLKNQMMVLKGRLNAAYGKLRERESVEYTMPTLAEAERAAEPDDHWRWNDTLNKWFPPRWIEERNDTLTLWCNGVST